MPLTLRLSIRDNVSPAARRRTHADAALIADGLDFLTGHQVVHLRPAVSAMLARAAAARLRAVESAARIGGGM